MGRSLSSARALVQGLSAAREALLHIMQVGIIIVIIITFFPVLLSATAFGCGRRNLVG